MAALAGKFRDSGRYHRREVLQRDTGNRWSVHRHNFSFVSGLYLHCFSGWLDYFKLWLIARTAEGNHAESFGALAIAVWFPACRVTAHCFLLPPIGFIEDDLLRVWSSPRF